METPTVQRKTLTVDTTSWHFRWYVWSLDIIYRFFDGNTLAPSEAEKKRGNLCAYVQARTAAIAILVLQAAAIGTLAWALTGLPAELFGILGYLNFLRMGAAAILMIAAGLLIVFSLVAGTGHDALDRDIRIHMNLGALGALVIARLLAWNNWGGLDSGGTVGVLVMGLLAALIAGILGAREAYERKEEERRRNMRYEPSYHSDRTEESAKSGEPGFFALLWLYAKAAKARICPLIEPVRNGRSTVITEGEA